MICEENQEQKWWKRDLNIFKGVKLLLIYLFLLFTMEDITVSINNKLDFHMGYHYELVNTPPKNIIYIAQTEIIKNHFSFQEDSAIPMNEKIPMKP